MFKINLSKKSHFLIYEWKVTMPVSMDAMKMKCDKNVKSLALFTAWKGTLIIVGIPFLVKTFAELELLDNFCSTVHFWYFF